MPAHPTKTWWRDATEGQRVYNLPPFLASFAAAPHRHGLATRGLGALTDVSQAQLMLELNNRVHEPLVSAQDRLPDVRRYSSFDYAAFADELGVLFEEENKIERLLATAPLPLSDADTEEILSQINNLAPDVEDFKQRVHLAARGGVEASMLRNTLVAVGVGAGAVALGWYVLAHRKRVKLRRK